MAEQTKRRRVRIRFLPGPRPARPIDADDPLADAANPSPAWLLEVTEDGRDRLGTWELWHPADLASLETLKLLSIERDVEALSAHQYVGRVREQIKLLIPDLPAEVFELLTHRQLQAIGAKCWEMPGETRQERAERKEDAANPPAGERVSV